MKTCPVRSNVECNSVVNPIVLIVAVSADTATCLYSPESVFL